MSSPHNPKRSAKSPFLIIPEFVSPMTCEEIIGELNFTTPDVHPETSRPFKTVMTNTIADAFIADILEQGALNQVERQYGVEVENISSIAYEWFPERYQPTAAMAEAHTPVNGKWVRAADHDLTAVLFLMDYHNGKSIDTTFEVYGGKLEFPSFNFGFNPRAGMLVAFPSAPNFANATSAIHVGELFQARIQLRTTRPYAYSAANFPGTHHDWFG